jgi:L-amino acid N-acyltransferase YncA
MELETESPPGVEVVAAESHHLPEIAAIYAEEVRSSAATFDLEAPGLGYWARSLEQVDPDAGHHLLAALDPGDGRVLGYAKSGRFRERAAYDTTCEVSIYLARDARGRGVAKALYARLFELLDASPLHLAVAGMTEPNPASHALPRAFGFERVGTFSGVGIKFGRAWDVTWYQRPLER